MDPTPTSLSTRMVPPSNSTNRLESGSPSPVPLTRVFWFALHLNELLKDSLLVLSCDAYPCIRNLKGDESLPLQLGCKANRSRGE